MSVKTTAVAFLAVIAALGPSGCGDQTPSEVLFDAGTDLPGEVVADVSGEARDLPVEVAADVPPEMPAEVPPEVPVEVPEVVPADTPEEMPAEVLADTPAEIPPPPLECNGSQVLCARRYDEVAYPTTHNAMSNADENWVPPNQHHGIERQLADGVRALMLDLWYGDGDSTDAKTVYLCHGVCGLGNRPLVDALNAVRVFLDGHPGDVVTLIFESYAGAADVAAAFQEAGLSSYLHTQPADASWPTLFQMAQSGRRLVVFTDSAPGTPAWYHDLWVHAFETPWSAKTAADLSCDVNRGNPANRLFILNHFAADPFPTEEGATALNSNPFFLDKALECQAERNRLPNFPTVDFHDLGDLFAVVRALNGLEEAPTTAR